MLGMEEKSQEFFAKISNAGSLCIRWISWFKSFWNVSNKTGGHHNRFGLIRDLLYIYTWKSFHKILTISGMPFYIGGWLIAILLLQVYYPPTGALLFWTVFVFLEVGAATVDKLRKENAGL